MKQEQTKQTKELEQKELELEKKINRTRTRKSLLDLALSNGIELGEETQQTIPQLKEQFKRILLERALLEEETTKPIEAVEPEGIIETGVCPPVSLHVLLEEEIKSTPDMDVPIVGENLIKVTQRHQDGSMRPPCVEYFAEANLTRWAADHGLSMDTVACLIKHPHTSHCGLSLERCSSEAPRDNYLNINKTG